jgi:predicted aspartyl protease
MNKLIESVIAIASLLAFAPHLHAGSADDAAAALAAGDLPRAATLYEALYREGQKQPAVLLALARLAVWRNHLDEADKYVRAIDSAAPEASPATAITKTIALRRSDDSPELYQGVPSSPVTIPFLARDPLPTLVGKVNGREAGFLIDTGADQLVIDEELAKQLKIISGDAQNGTFAGGKTGAVAHGLVEHLELGQLSLTHIPVTILPTRRFTGFAHQVDGIIGTRFLARFRATIDYPYSRLVLAPRKSAPEASKSATTLPLWLIGDHFLYTAGQLNDKQLGMWLVDTGLAGGGVMIWDRKIADAAGVKLDAGQTETGMGGGGEVSAISFTATKMTLRNAEARNVPGKFIQGSPIGAGPAFKVAGIVSHDFFKGWALTIDIDRMELVLDK